MPVTGTGAPGATVGASRGTIRGGVSPDVPGSALGTASTVGVTGRGGVEGGGSRCGWRAGRHAGWVADRLGVTAILRPLLRGTDFFGCGDGLGTEPHTYIRELGSSGLNSERIL